MNKIPERMPLHLVYVLDLACAVLPRPNVICGRWMKGTWAVYVVPDFLG